MVEPRPEGAIMPKGHSCLRFSTPDQQRGDSFRRQADMPTTYAPAHDLDLDDSLTFRDLGVAAWQGKNSGADGALGQFMRAAKSGVVPVGSFLLVENLDRISRQFAREALQLLQDIVKTGITLVTLGGTRRGCRMLWTRWPGIPRSLPIASIV